MKDNNDALKFVTNAEEKIKASQRRLFFVIDQVNDLIGERAIDFLIMLKDSCNCIFASSANNAKHFLERQTYFNPNVDEELVRFNSRQFRSFCKILKLEFDEIEEEQIMSVTGAVPLLLFEFLKTNFLEQTNEKTIEEAIQDFINLSKINIYNSVNFDKYLKETLKNEKDEIESACENIYNLIRGKPIEDNVTYDRRFLFEVPANKSKTLYTLEAVNSTAFTQIVKHYLNLGAEQENYRFEKRFISATEKENLVPACRDHLT